MRGKIHREKCDVQTRPYDKTKPNVCKAICNIIVQRNFWRFSADLPENRYRIISKIVAKSVMILIIVRPLYRRCEEWTEDEMKKHTPPVEDAGHPSPEG